MKVLALLGMLVAVAAPSKTVQLAIVHTVQGCHVWQSAAHNAGAATKVRLAPGGKVTVRISCPMDFTLVQVAGPRIALGDPTLHTGTQRTFRFPKKGVYVLRATNIQSSEQMGMQTLGPDNVLTLTVTVR
jgi:hypothetical protein